MKDVMSTKVFFVTSRNRIVEEDSQSEPVYFGTEINEDIKNPLHFGKAWVNNDNNNNNKLKADISETPDSEELCCSQEIFDEIQDRMSRGIDTIILFHGFGNSFRNAIIGAAELKDLYEQEGNCKYTMIVFSWPSDGRVRFSSYTRDRRDACRSREFFGPSLSKMGQFLTELCQARDNQKITSDTAVKNEDLEKQNNKVNCGRLHIMAHSMGNYVLRCTLQELRERGKISQLFDEILLIAADEDEDAFEHEHKLKLLPELAERVSVYFNQGDDALEVSESNLLIGNIDRLGSGGPSQPDDLPKNVFLINCENVISESIMTTEHDYHKTEPEVISDISYVLTGWTGDIPGRIYFPETNSYDLEPISITPKRTLPFLGIVRIVQEFLSRLRHFRLF